MLKPARLTLVRSRFQRDRYAAAIEVLTFAGAACLWAISPLPRTIVPFVALAWLSQWLRGKSWRDAGLRKPDPLLLTILVGVGVAVGAELAGALAIAPLLTRLTGEGPTTAAFQYLRNNRTAWLGLVVLIWPLAAVMEEMVYRGYFLNRVADVFGRTRMGWFVGLVTSSLLFALAHGQYTLRFLATSLMMGLLEGSLYMAWKRNLWMPIIIHGMADTITLTLVFFGAI